ncbi:MAG: ABC-type transport auxiliary lipoprotein family protein [Steroidobacteraceae bacterium]
MRRTLYAPVTVAMAVLSGCGGLRSHDVPDQVYLLRADPAPQAPAAEVQPLKASVRIARPQPQPGFDTDRIIVIRGDRRFDAFSGSRWAAPLPDVVAALAVETLRASGRFADVQDDRAPFSADYLLRMTVRHFEAEYTGAAAAPDVRVSFDCVVGRRSERTTIATFTAEASMPAAGNRMGVVVEAFERAARAALARVADETAAAVAGDAQGVRTTTAR